MPHVWRHGKYFSNFLLVSDLAQECAPEFDIFGGDNFTAGPHVRAITVRSR